MSSQIQINDETELKINPNDVIDNPNNNDNTQQEPKVDEQEAKKLKSKFNLFEQGRLMVIGNVDEISKNIIIIGPKGSGKSSIFSLLTTGSPNNYTDNGTCGLNFGFMRSQDSSQKKVINVYEIGNDFENLKLIKNILNNDNFESTIILITLDFENPNSQLTYLLRFLSELRKILTTIIDVNNLENNIKNRIALYANNQRPVEVDVFPIETYVIGNKYDLLETIDIEKLKWLCPSLRYFCYINGLNLIFYSSKKKELIKALYNTVVEFGFGSGKSGNLKKYFQKNSTKALYINYYNDNLNDIGEPKIPVTVTGDIMQRWKETYDGLFKNFKKNNENNRKIDLDESYYELYKEGKIDHELKLFNDFKETQNENQKNKYYQKSGINSSATKYRPKKK
jgi:adenylate kinase family enzyme